MYIIARTGTDELNIFPIGNSSPATIAWRANDPGAKVTISDMQYMYCNGFYIGIRGSFEW